MSTSRDHVVDIMTRLADALPENVLNNREKPLLVAVNGDRNAGKSLLPFVFRDHLFGGQEQDMGGRKEFDERWTVPDGKGKDLEIGFVNLIWAYMDFSDTLKENFPKDRRPEKQEIADAFFAQRQKGGVTFISFADQADIQEGLKIEIYKNGIVKKLAEGDSLKDSFLDVAARHSDGDWLRMINIEVTDPRLLASPTFMQAVESIRDVYDHKPTEPQTQKPTHRQPKPMTM